MTQEKSNEKMQLNKLLLGCPECGNTKWTRKDKDKYGNPDDIWKCSICGEYAHIEEMTAIVAAACPF